MRLVTVSLDDDFVEVFRSICYACQKTKTDPSQTQNPPEIHQKESLQLHRQKGKERQNRPNPAQKNENPDH